jgi:energy-coupling factor transporter ATP-binding protein EcfA2
VGVISWLLVGLGLSYGAAKLLEHLVSSYVNRETLPAGVLKASKKKRGKTSRKRRKRSQKALKKPQQESSSSEVLADVTSALSNLGYKKRDASEAARKAVETLGADRELPELIVVALQWNRREEKTW